MNLTLKQGRINRAEAEKSGSKTYQSKNCKICGGSERYTKSTRCVNCARKNGRKAYNRLDPERKQQRIRKTTERQRDYQKGYHKRYAEKRDIRQVLVDRAWYRARTKGIDFDITEEDIEIPERCPDFGYPMQKSGDKFNTPSLDRFDNTKGYTKDNIRVISTRANLLKSNGTLEDFKALVKWMEGSTCSQ